VSSGLIITYDIGTTSCKTLIFDLEGNIVSSSEKEYEIIHPEALWAEQDPDDWWKAIVDTTQACLKNLNHLEVKRISGIGLCSQRESIVPIDSNGKKLMNCILWMDRRSIPQSEEISSHFGKNEIYSKTGVIPDPLFSAPKLYWIAQNKKDILNQTKFFLQPKDFICFKLTGEIKTDYTLASRTMLFDLRSLSWWEDMLKFIHVDKSQLPPVYPPHHIAGTLTSQAADILSLSKNIPVIIGAGDRQSEALGAGIFDNKRALESTGTGTNISSASESYLKLSNQIICSKHALAKFWQFEQGNTTTGAILKWFKNNIFTEQQFKKPAIEENNNIYLKIDSEIKKSPPGANKLLMLPYFLGRKSAKWNPHAKGAIFGLTLSHKTNDIGSSILEGISFEIKSCLDILESIGVPIKEIVVVGGGANSSVWNQIKADITGRAMTVPKITQAASLGAMILAATGLGIINDPMNAAIKLNPPIKTFKPDKILHGYYCHLFQIYTKLYDSIDNLFDDLDKIVRRHHD